MGTGKKKASSNSASSRSLPLDFLLKPLLTCPRCGAGPAAERGRIALRSSSRPCQNVAMSGAGDISRGAMLQVCSCPVPPGAAGLIWAVWTCGTAKLGCCCCGSKAPVPVKPPPAAPLGHFAGCVCGAAGRGCWHEGGCHRAGFHGESGQKVNQQFIYSSIHLVWCNSRNLGSGRLRHFV